MAQGTLTVFNAFTKSMADGSHDLDNDAFKVMLLSNTVGGATPTISAADTTPDSSDYIEAVGTGYTPGGEAITVTFTEVSGIATFKVTSGTIQWLKNAAGPINIRSALIYNVTHAGVVDAIGYIDLTTDGITALSMVASDINVTFSDNGIFKIIKA
jgi:hypothetical protein